MNSLGCRIDVHGTGLGETYAVSYLVKLLFNITIVQAQSGVIFLHNAANDVGQLVVVLCGHIS